MTATAQSKTSRAWLDDMVIALRDAVMVTGACFAVGLLINQVRPDGIPLVAAQEYEIFAPCPEPGGEIDSVAADAPILFAEDTFVVDARSEQEFDVWRFRRPANVPYDYLEPTPEETLQRLAKTVARSRARRVVVYGDGDVPDTGEQLATEISGHGIKHVSFVTGGAPALRASNEAGGDR